MTPKQKAIELIERIESVRNKIDFRGSLLSKFYRRRENALIEVFSMQSDQHNKSCAMIIIDEVLKVIPEDKKVTRVWWGWVKNEVEKL